MVSIGVLLFTLAFQAQDGGFERDVLPVFAKRCQSCHGAQQQMAGLRLDRADASQAAAATKLADRVSSEKRSFRMPPVGDALQPKEIAAIRDWAGAGAKWPAGAGVAGHWSFQAPVKKGAGIDSWIAARLLTEGITPSPAADRRTLIRRVSLDLTGLPPSPSEVADLRTAFGPRPSPASSNRTRR